MSEPNRGEQIIYLTEWAAKNGAVLTLAGQVGFGRDATGIMIDDHYIDTDEHLGPWWQPEDAYHKHDCLCVLGHGDGPLRQLYDWVRWLDEHGYTVEVVPRHPENEIDLWFHGVSRPRLVERK